MVNSVVFSENVEKVLNSVVFMSKMAKMVNSCTLSRSVVFSRKGQNLNIAVPGIKQGFLRRSKPQTPLFYGHSSAFLGNEKPLNHRKSRYLRSTVCLMALFYSDTVLAILVKT